MTHLVLIKHHIFNSMDETSLPNPPQHGSHLVSHAVHDTGSDPHWGWFGSGAETRMKPVNMMQHHARGVYGLEGKPLDIRGCVYGLASRHQGACIWAIAS